MYQNKARPRLCLNLKSQPGFNAPTPQRFPRFNNTQRWNSPPPQIRMKNNLPLETPYNNFQPEFSQHCRKSPVPNNMYDFNDQGHHPRSPAEFHTSPQSFQESQNDASNFRNIQNQTPNTYDSFPSNNSRSHQNRYPPLNLNESNSFPRNDIVNNVQDTEGSFSGPSSSFQNAIPGLEVYDNQFDRDCGDLEYNFSEKFGDDEYNDKWRRQDKIPFLSEPNNLPAERNAFYSSKHSIDFNSDLGHRHSHSTPNNNDGLWNEPDTKDKYQNLAMPQSKVLENTPFRADRKGVRNESTEKCDSKSVLEQAIETLVTDDAVVGLDYIVEYKNSLSSASSLSFRCNLCNSAISRPSILNHVLGGKHRLRYVKLKDEKKYNQLLGLNIEESLKEFAISAASIELEQLHGRGKVRIELKHADSSIPSNYEEHANSSSAVLNFSDIPITSDNMSPQNEFTSSSMDSTRNNDAQEGTYSQQEAGFLPDVAFRNANKMPLLEAKQSSHFHSPSKISEPYSSSSIRHSENTRFGTEIQQYENVSNHPFSSQASLSDSRENIVYSNYANRPIPCAQEETHGAQHSYDNQEFLQDANKAGRSPPRFLSSPNSSKPEMGFKRSASSVYFHPDDNLRKMMKTEIEMDNANKTSSSFQSQHFLSERDKSYNSPLFTNTNESSKVDSNVLLADENSKPQSYPSKDEVTNEMCSSVMKLEENVTTESILEILMKCSISSEEEASSILKIITVLIELFIKYKLQHIPRNTVEFFIKSLREGHTEDILKFLGCFDNDKKGLPFGLEVKPENTCVPESEITKYSNRQDQLQNPSEGNLVIEKLTGIKQDLTDNPEGSKLDTKFGISNTMQGDLKTESMNNAQYCNSFTNSESAALNNYNLASSVPTSNFSVPPPPGPALQITSTAESLMPPPFFAQPATPTTKQDWPVNQSPIQAPYPPSQDHVMQGNWNAPFQASMQYARGPYFQPPPQGPMIGGTPQFMGMHQFPQHFPANQHFVNQQFYPNMAYSANVNMERSPFPPVPQMPLPTGPHPPLPPGPQPPIPSGSQPLLPNPPLPPSDSHSAYGLGSNMQLTPTSQFAPPLPPQPQPPPPPPPPTI